MDTLYSLILALAAGLLIGVERGWKARAGEEGSRIAGIRTFGLLGLLGGLWWLLAGYLGALLMGFAFLAVAGLLIVAHVLDVRADRDMGITTTVAALITFTLGALAVSGEQVVTAAGAVVTALLLNLKPQLHTWLQRLQAIELDAGLKLLLISVVVLPVLPNQGFGPWAALNPRTIWWMVVLIAAIGFAGYFAVKYTGARRGLAYTGLFGGLVSSTAVSLSLSRLAPRIDQPRLIACAVLLAAATMLPRLLLEVAVIEASLLPALLPPLLGMALPGYLIAWWLWRNSPPVNAEPLTLSNPLELGTALRFALLLAAVMLLAEWLSRGFGDRGLYLLAFFSGLADADAVTLSLSRMVGAGLAAATAVNAIVITAAVNTLVKGVLVALIGGREVARYLLPSMALMVGCGAGLLLLA